MNKIFDVRINSRYLGFLLKQEFKMMFVLFLVYFLFMPFSTFMFFEANATFEAINTDLSRFFTFGTLIFIMTTIILPCVLMSFIMNRNKMDTYQALPIRKQDFFFNHFIQILIVLLAPFLINWLLNMLLILFYNHGVFPNDILLNWFLNPFKTILFTPLLMGISLFAYVNSGRILDGILYSILLHMVQFFSGFFIDTLFNSRLFGLSNSVDSMIQSYFSYDFALIQWTFDFIFRPMTLIWIILGLILYFVNQELYSKRKVERIDDSAVNPWFIHVIINGAFILLLSYMLLTFMYNSTILNQLILPLFLGLIVYLITDAIMNRGFQYLFKAMVRYFFIALISLSLVYSLVITGLFGATQKVLKEDQFDSVIVTTLHHNGYPSDVSDTNDYSDVVRDTKTIQQILNLPKYYFIPNTSLVLSDNLSKEAVLDFQSKLVESYYEDIIAHGFQPHLYNTQQYLNLNFNEQDYYGTEVYLTFIQDKEIVLRRHYRISQAVFDYFYHGPQPSK